MKVSVIVPVYKVEQYISKCLDSLVNQTLEDMEIIVVNDGSPDNSEKIIKDYAKKYKNIKYLKKENGGLSSARNFGLKHATGEYIGFVDSDDYVDKRMYQMMYEKAIEASADLVVCDLNYVYEDKEEKAYSNIKTDTTDIKSIMNNIYPAAWNKLYKKELFDNEVYFKEGVWYEDVEFIYRLLPYVNKIGVVHEHFYKYIQRENSIIRTIDKRLYNYIDNWNGILEFYKKRDLYISYEKELEYSYVRYLYATFIKQACKYDYENYLKAVDEAIKNVKNSFPKYRKNKYFYKSLKGIYLIIFNKDLAKILYKKGKQ